MDLVRTHKFTDQDKEVNTMDKKLLVSLSLFFPMTILITTLALAASAFITDHSREFFGAVIYVFQSLFPTGGDRMFEFELIAMIAGGSILLILTRLILFTDRQRDAI